MTDIKELTILLVDNLKKIRQQHCNLDLNRIPIGISGRHIHLSSGDLEILFGKDYVLTPIKNLSQPGQYACKEQVTLIGSKGIIDKVRIIGPTRSKTQAEILMADAFKLGVEPVIRLSGDLDDTPGLTVVGPKGIVTINEGVIVAMRHIHLNYEQGQRLGLNNGEVVSIKSEGIRSAVLDNVVVRMDENGYMDCHIDQEEANALGLKNGSYVKIIK